MKGKSEIVSVEEIKATLIGAHYDMMIDISALDTLSRVVYGLQLQRPRLERELLVRVLVEGVPVEDGEGRLSMQRWAAERMADAIIKEVDNER